MWIRLIGGNDATQFFSTKGSCAFKILFAFASGEEKFSEESHLSCYELSWENFVDSEFLLNTRLEAGLPTCCWEMPFAPISGRPEQGLQNQDVVIASFQLIPYHVAQGRQSWEGNSKPGTMDKSNQAVTCSESQSDLFLSAVHREKVQVEFWICPVKIQVFIPHISLKILCFHNQIY